MNYIYTAILMVVFFFSQGLAQNQAETAKWVQDQDTLSLSFGQEIGEADRKTSGVNELSFEHLFSTPKIIQNDNFSRMEFPGTTQWNASADAPLIPVKTFKVLLPYGREISKVKVILGKLELVPGQYLLEPAGKPQPIGEKIQDLDTVIYNSDDLYPPLPCGEVFFQKKRGYLILFFNFFPLQYHPLSGRVGFYDQVKIVLETIPAQEAGLTKPMTDEETLAELRSLVDNPQTVESYLSLR